LEIKNPVNADLAFMRPSLLINLAKNIAKNPDAAGLRQFEVGKIFGVSLRMEPTMLAGVVRGASFFDAKGSLEFVCKQLGLADFRCAAPGGKTDSLFDAGQSARIFANGREIGILGRISPSIARAIGLNEAIVFELSVDVLAAMATEKIEYKPISAHPCAIRDLAILAPREVYAQIIIDVMRAAAGPLVKSIEPIDIYQGDKISAGLKNIAFRITYQANDRTLSGSEIDKMQADIIVVIEAAGWQIRRTNT
jgi:phenylalanyl-tRNA synthetase beta chain